MLFAKDAKHLGEIVGERTTLILGPAALTTHAKQLRIAPATLNTLIKGEYPGKISFDSAKALGGRIESLVRVCKILYLDVPSCLEACGLPQRSNWIAKGLASNAKPQTINLQDLEDLTKILSITGTMPVDTFLLNLSLVQEGRKL